MRGERELRRAEPCMLVYVRRSSVYDGTISFEPPTSSPSVERLSVSRGFILLSALAS